MSRGPAFGLPMAGRPRGFAMISAVFLVVVLGALGTYIVMVSTTQQVGSAFDVQGARLYQAARAGLEWGLYKQVRDGSCTGAPGVSFVPTAPTLSVFTVTVTCQAYADVNGGPTVHEIVSTACNQPAGGACPNTAGNNLYVERRLRVAI